MKTVTKDEFWNFVALNKLKPISSCTDMDGSQPFSSGTPQTETGYGKEDLIILAVLNTYKFDEVWEYFYQLNY